MLLMGGFILSVAMAPLALASEKSDKMDKLKATYPLTTCPVSGEKLGSMGGYDYLYKTKVNGVETERLVRFCCNGCVKEFNKNPDKYLKMIDDAAQKK